MRKNKILSMQEAVAEYIKPGSTMVISSGVLSRSPMALTREIIRQGIGGLKIQGYSQGLDVDMLAAAGLLDTVESVYVGIPGFGLAPNFRRAVQNGAIKAIDISEVAMQTRLRARAFGLPFEVTTSILGSDLLQHHPEAKEFECPFSGEKVVLMRAGTANVALIHAQWADPYGNVQFYDKPEIWEDVVYRAADHVIVTVEEIVEPEFVQSQPNKTLIPGYFVDAVVEAPWGAHPTQCDWAYIFDNDHINEYLESAKKGTFDQYMEKYVYNCKDHHDYLKVIGVESILKTRYTGKRLWPSEWEKA